MTSIDIPLAQWHNRDGIPHVCITDDHLRQIRDGIAALPPTDKTHAYQHGYEGDCAQCGEEIGSANHAQPEATRLKTERDKAMDDLIAARIRCEELAANNQDLRRILTDERELRGFTRVDYDQAQSEITALKIAVHNCKSAQDRAEAELAAERERREKAENERQVEVDQTRQNIGKLVVAARADAAQWKERAEKAEKDARIAHAQKRKDCIECLGLDASQANAMERERDALRSEVDKLKKIYLDIADSVAPETHGAEDVIQRICELRARKVKLEAVYEAASALATGQDWNNGTMAKTHGYRQKLIDAIRAAGVEVKS